MRVRGAEIQSYVDEYYSVARFQAAYVAPMPTMTDKTQWVKVDLGFTIYPPIQEKRPPGRPRVQRIRGFLEPGKKVVKCKKCKQPGHFKKKLAKIHLQNILTMLMSNHKRSRHKSSIKSSHKSSTRLVKDLVTRYFPN
jgi:hypothetical protein